MPGWANGNSLAILFQHNHTHRDGQRWVEAFSPTRNGVSTPALEVTWSPALDSSRSSPPPLPSLPPLPPLLPPLPPLPPASPPVPNVPPATPPPPLHPGNFLLVSNSIELREAIQNSVRLIFIPEGVKLEANGTLVLSGSGASVHLMSDGAGALLSSSNQTRLFEVYGGAELRLTNMHLRHGAALEFWAGGSSSGGTLRISGRSSAILTNSSIANSSAFNGGAVHIDGNSLLLLDSSSISDCKALADGGAVFAEGGSLVKLMADCMISACSAGSGRVTIRAKGGGLLLAEARMEANSSHISRCIAEEGGGIACEASDVQLHGMVFSEGKADNFVRTACESQTTATPSSVSQCEKPTSFALAPAAGCCHEHAAALACGLDELYLPRLQGGRSHGQLRRRRRLFCVQRVRLIVFKLSGAACVLTHVFVLCRASVFVSHCLFERCTAGGDSNGFGAIHVATTHDLLVVQHSSFRNCSCSRDTSGSSGSAL